MPQGRQGACGSDVAMRRPLVSEPTMHRPSFGTVISLRSTGRTPGRKTNGRFRPQRSFNRRNRMAAASRDGMGA